MDIARTCRYVRTTLPPASRSLLRTRNAALSAAVSMLMSVAAATGPSLRRIAGTSSATSECVQVAAVRSALSGGARTSVSGTWTYSLLMQEWYRSGNLGNPASWVGWSSRCFPGRKPILISQKDISRLERVLEKCEKKPTPHFSAHWPSQSPLSSGLNDQPTKVARPFAARNSRASRCCAFFLQLHRSRCPPLHRSSTLSTAASLRAQATARASQRPAW